MKIEFTETRASYKYFTDIEQGTIFIFHCQRDFAKPNVFQKVDNSKYVPLGFLGCHKPSVPKELRVVPVECTLTVNPWRVF